MFLMIKLEMCKLFIQLARCGKKLVIGFPKHLNLIEYIKVIKIFSLMF